MESGLAAEPRTPGKPRVAVTVEQFWHRVPGGTARATRGILDALVTFDEFDLRGIAARHSDNELSSQQLPISTGCFPLPRPVLYESWHRLGLFPVQKVVGEVDVVWASAMVVPPSSAPMVVTVNDIDFLKHPERLSARGRTFFPRAWQVTLDRADVVVCPSKVVAADVTAHGANPDRVRVVPLGVDRQTAGPDEVEKVCVEYSLPKRFALWVGTVEPRKNLEGVVAAMSRLEGIDLVVVGPDGWQVEGCDVLAPLAGRVHRTGWVGEEDLRALYAAAEVFVFPSLAEGFGLPVLEAMAQGTPVVTSLDTATAEVAADSAVLVDPTDVASIAEGIKRVTSDPQLRETLSARGRSRAASYSWDDTGRGYSEIFRELLDR